MKEKKWLAVIWTAEGKGVVGEFEGFLEGIIRKKKKR